MFSATVNDGITADIEAITKRMVVEQRDLGRTVAKLARKVLVADVRSRRGTLSFSGMGTKLGARTRVLARGDGATVFLDAVPAGAWAIAEHGRAVSVPKRKKALTINGGFAMSASATTGRPGLWAGAEGAIDTAVTDELETQYDRMMGV